MDILEVRENGMVIYRTEDGAIDKLVVREDLVHILKMGDIMKAFSEPFSTALVEACFSDSEGNAIPREILSEIIASLNIAEYRLVQKAVADRLLEK